MVCNQIGLLSYHRAWAYLGVQTNNLIQTLPQNESVHAKIAYNAK